LRVEPESVQFPEVAVGETVAETVTVENRGSAPLTVTRAEVGDSEVFALADAVTDSEVTLEPGASRELTVSFTPEAQQSYTGYLFVETDAPDAPDRTIALTSSDITATVESNESADAVSARTNASAGERVEIAFPGVPDDQQYRTDSVAVTPAVDGAIEVNVTTSNETLAAVRETTNGTTAGFADNTTRLGNISASTNLDDENIEQAEFTATVDRSRFETRNTNASDISFYRFDEEELEWVKQNTTVVNRTETTVTVRVVGDGFSEWTAAAARPEFSIDDTEVNVTTATVGEEVEIEVFVTNTGGTEGTYVAELLLNGAVVEDQTAIIASEGQENFLFQRSIDDPGEYEVQVNEAFVATINITESGAEVEENPPENGSDNGGSDDDMLLFAVPVVVVIVAVAGLGVFYSRRRQEGDGAGTAEDER
jgi:PGF-pre-PGF domain-containing protein